MEENLKVSSPWVKYVHKMKELFDHDTDVLVQYDNVANKVKLLVTGTDKAWALGQLLPEEKEFGNVTLKIEVVPANRSSEKADLIEMALKGNRAFVEMIRKDIPGAPGGFNYVMMTGRVVQFFNDNMRDPYGNESCLYQDIAKDIFEEDANLAFCTSIY